MHLAQAVIFGILWRRLVALFKGHIYLACMTADYRCDDCSGALRRAPGLRQQHVM
tara:strand:+ start:346 stop:510 length:165 start_codon:yes stop_codon:yes gene_type:complete